jgi:hypothetical protein
MHGKSFVLSGENLTLGTGNVLAAIRTAADAVTAGGVLELLRLDVFQVGSTTNALIRGEIATRDTAGTLTMTSKAPRALRFGSVASAIQGSTAPAGTAARSGINSSADSGGTYTTEIPFGFHNQSGLQIIWTPEDRPIVNPASVVAVRLLATPTSTTGWGFNLYFRELV